MPLRIGQTGAGILVSGSAGILKISNGDISNTRSISISGSGDVVFNITSSGIIHTFPSVSTNLVGTDVTQSLTNKSGSFIQLQIQASGSAPTFTPTQASDKVTLFFNTGSNFLYAYTNGAWRSASFV